MQGGPDAPRKELHILDPLQEVRCLNHVQAFTEK